ncbi:hypothetical protein EDC94DRAFT_603910 [Helicostylum pulchrum]|nr:hypothetical protein EDC94DRAFT_603910 [Helicostylum pulchrum]
MQETEPIHHVLFVICILKSTAFFLVYIVVRITFVAIIYNVFFGTFNLFFFYNIFFDAVHLFFYMATVTI